MIPRHKASSLAQQTEELSFDVVLVPIDFSEHSENALVYASTFAQRFNSRLLLVHVVQSVSAAYDFGRSSVSEKLDQELRTFSERKLRDLATRIVNSSVEVECLICSGNPVEEIVNAAKQNAADIIITATHGRTGLKHVFLGSVTEGINRYAHCPVLVTRSKEKGTGAAPSADLDVHSVLVAVDFSDLSNLALSYAEAIVKKGGGSIVMVHVAPIHYPISEYGVLECPQLDAEVVEAGRKSLVELAEAESDENLPITCEVRQGKAGVEILEVATRRAVDLIVIGTRGLTGLKHVLLGSTAEYVVRHASCPVLVVRNPVQEEQRVGAAEVRSSAASRGVDVRQDIVQTHPLFENMTHKELEVLLKDSSIVEFEAGEVLFREGEYANKFYILHEGKVALECHQPGKDVIVQTTDAGDVLGWSWLFPPFSWHFQARAIDKTVALELNGAHILIASESDDRLGHRLMRRFAQILIHRLQETRKRLIELSQKAEIDLGETL